MSGYLTNLVRRATAPEPAVRPRLPSIFGPVPAAAWDGQSAVSEDDSHTEAAAPRREDRAPAASAWPPQPLAEDELAAEQAVAPQRSAASPLRADGIIAPSAKSGMAAAGADRPFTQRGNAAAPAVSVPPEAPAGATTDDVARSSVSTTQTASARLQPPARAPDAVVRSNDPAVETPRPASTRPTSNATQGSERGGRSSDAPPADPASDPVSVPRQVDLRHPASDDHDEPSRLMTAQRALGREPRDRVEPASPQVARAARLAHADLQPDITEPSPPSSLDWSEQTPGETAESEVTSRRRSGSDAGRRWPQVSAHAREDRDARNEAPHNERSAAAQPVVHVTIGRVEVRASMSAEPRQRTRSSTGTTSLDDYLRQRSGRSSS